MNTVRARYMIETPLDPARVAETLAGEQSSGTFVRVQGESDALQARSRATVHRVETINQMPSPSLPSAYLTSRDITGPWTQASVEVDFPAANFGNNLPTLAATLAGNLYDIGETTGVRLEHIDIPPAVRALFDRPLHGIEGTRRLSTVTDRPLFGTIIKPNVGLSADETAQLVSQLCEAGIDFIKDDEVNANSEHAPLVQRIPAVMKVVRRWRESSGKPVMVAFNITDEFDAMRRHADLIAREEGSCAMVSLNWCGFSSVQTLRRESGLVIHGHRNGFGMFSRHPALGMSFQAYQALWRLAGVDHMHVHGLSGKFSQPDKEVISSAQDCLRPLSDAEDVADRVMPAFSSGQWAGTLPETIKTVPSGDFLFMCGGGILAHPGGAAAGVRSLHDAWAAARSGQTLDAYARTQPAPALADALAFFRNVHG